MGNHYWRKKMNILIRNYNKNIKPMVLGSILTFYCVEKYDELQTEMPYVAKYNEKLGCNYTVIKQGNGNMLFDFKEEKDERK